jgi:hypothetical protein
LLLPFTNESSPAADSSERDLVVTTQVLVYNVAAFKYGGILDITPTEFDDLWKVRTSTHS